MARNNKVVINSIIGLVCLILTFRVHWMFILPVAIIVWVNQKELLKK